MLVTSAMKSIATFDAAPQAVNFLTRNVPGGKNLSNPSATEEGTPLVHYSPAMVEKNTILTIEFGFDEFPDETFDIVGNALNQAAGIPIFLAAGAHLLTAGAITKLLGKVGSILFDRSPVFKADVALEFDRPGGLVPTADFRLITVEEWDTREREKYEISASGLRRANGQLYEGEKPYIIISLDGRKQQEYENFSPTAASAAMLERFFDIGDGQELRLEPLIDAIKLYNDWTFRQRADRVRDELKDLEEGTEEYVKKKNEYEAFVKNIVNDLLKPKV